MTMVVEWSSCVEQCRTVFQRDYSMPTHESTYCTSARALSRGLRLMELPAVGIPDLGIPSLAL